MPATCVRRRSQGDYTGRIPRILLCVALLAISLTGQVGNAVVQDGAGRVGPPFDEAGERWVEDTLQRMSLDERIGQLLVVGVQSSFLPTESDAFERVARAVREFHAGGLVVFGVADATGPALGQPLAAASTINRLQSMARTPLLVAADFEFGAGMRLAGATAFPRAMAFTAAGEPELLEEAARLTARESRSIGIHLNLAPVSDINTNPRNPVINTRAFGETPAHVTAMVSAYVRGLQQEGMLATLKHFPGHGDTDVDSHIGLPLIPHARFRLEEVELQPFKAGIGAGAAAVMTSHIELPALEPQPQTPVTFSPAIVSSLLREELGFKGLVLTDSLGMAGLSKLAAPREAIVRALLAGHDLLLDVPDAEDAFFAIGAAVERGEVSLDRIDESVRRILRAKARLGLHRGTQIDLDAVADRVGTRAASSLAATVAARAVTLLQDDGRDVPLRQSADASVLLLSVLDSRSAWGAASPARAAEAALRARWASTTTVEVSDRSTESELGAAAIAAAGVDLVIAAVFARTASGSGRIDLPAPLVGAVNQMGRTARSAGKPMVAIVFGNPYAAASLRDVPVLALTYDWTALAEQTAVRALLGQAPIAGRVPVSIGPADWPRGFGLAR